MIFDRLSRKFGYENKNLQRHLFREGRAETTIFLRIINIFKTQLLLDFLTNLRVSL